MCASINVYKCFRNLEYAWHRIYIQTLWNNFDEWNRIESQAVPCHAMPLSLLNCWRMKAWLGRLSSMLFLLLLLLLFLLSFGYIFFLFFVFYCMSLCDAILPGIHILLFYYFVDKMNVNDRKINNQMRCPDVMLHCTICDDDDKFFFFPLVLVFLFFIFIIGKKCAVWFVLIRRIS